MFDKFSGLCVDKNIGSIAWVHLTQSFQNLFWQINKSLIYWFLYTTPEEFSVFLWK